MAEGTDLRNTMPLYDWDAIELALANVSGRGSISDESTLKQLGIEPNAVPQGDPMAILRAINFLGGIDVLKDLQDRYRVAESNAKRGVNMGQSFVDDLRPLFLANDVFQGRVDPNEAHGISKFFEFEKYKNQAKDTIDSSSNAIPAYEKMLEEELAKRPFDPTVRSTKGMQDPQQIENIKRTIVTYKRDLEAAQQRYDSLNKTLEQYTPALQKYDLSRLTATTFPGQLQQRLTELNEQAPQQPQALAEKETTTAETGLTGIQKQLQDVYRQQLGRNPDQEGLGFYTKEIESGRKTFDQVVSELDRSLEGYNYDLETLNSRYRNLFGRNLDQEGLQYYMGLEDVTNSGFAPGTKLERQIIAGAQGVDVDSFKNKPVAGYTQIMSAALDADPYGGARATVSPYFFGSAEDLAQLDKTPSDLISKTQAGQLILYPTSLTRPGGQSYLDETGKFVFKSAEDLYYIQPGQLEKAIGLARISGALTEEGKKLFVTI